MIRIAASELILLGNPTLQNINTLGSITNAVELMMDGDDWDHSNGNWEKKKEIIAKTNIPLSVHPSAWDVNVASPIQAVRDAAEWLNLEAVEFCHGIGAHQIVFHPGVIDRSAGFSKTKALDRSYQMLDKMIAACKPYGIKIAFENISGPSLALFTQEEYIHALDGIDDSVYYLIDIGHANYNGWNIPETIDSVADRLCGFHIHDNNGKADQHLPIYRGSADWDNIFASMRQLPEDVLYILEYSRQCTLSDLEKGRDILLEQLD